MSRWIHWEEQPVETDDRKIPYSAGDCFFYTEYKEGDSLSPKAEEYFNITVNPEVSIDYQL